MPPRDLAVAGTPYHACPHPVTSRVAAKNSWQNGDALNLDEHFWTGKSSDRDQRARREVVAKDLLSQLSKSVAVTRIGYKHGHRHHVAQLASGLLQGLPQARKYLANLAVEIAR